MKNALVQIRINREIKTTLEEKSKNMGFKSLSEYLIVTGLNSDVKITVPSQDICSNIKQNLAELKMLLDSLCITDVKREPILKIIDVLKLEFEESFKEEVA